MFNEFERYVNSDFVTHLHPKEFATFDVLGFWKEKKTMFSVLSCMAMDLISVQASSVASESAFSTSGSVLSIRRTRLTPASLEMCMCLKDHLDAKERKQDKCPLEIPLDFEEDVFDDLFFMLNLINDGMGDLDKEQLLSSIPLASNCSISALVELLLKFMGVNMQLAMWTVLSDI
nr:zinc finger BED domain-containing protein RICESLEEPER 2 [Tanacetum cinerariifolium]